MKQQVQYKLLDDKRGVLNTAYGDTIIRCPFCGMKTSCEFVSTGYGISQHNRLYFINHCGECDMFFLSQHINRDPDIVLEATYPNAIYKSDLPKEVAEFSPSFIKIYTQSMTAKLENLTEIVGLGLRKALEYLISDYITNVIKLPLEKTLERRIDQINVTNVNVHATLARWVGNDHTHTQQKHPEFTIDDMIQSIQIIVYYLHAEYISKKLLNVIPQ